jgi:thiosulfate/3-mercaptopyruvate sulfurtransferase
MAFSMLVDTNTLNGKLDDPQWVVFDCRFSLKNPDEGREKYHAGHIPGARYANLDKDLSSPKQADTGRHPLPVFDEFIGWLRRNGVSQGSQVVVYDDVGGVIAGRLWWMLRMLGHSHVAVLDGGWKAWTRGKLAVTIDEPSPVVGDFDGQPASDWWVSTEDIEQMLENDGKRAPILDARAAPRYRGEKEPIDPKAGHVPGALNRPCDGNLDDQGYFQTPDRLRQAFEELLPDPEAAEVIHMCGSGVSACHNILAMELAGWPMTRLYVGSWSEWITDPGRVIETSI